MSEPCVPQVEPAKYYEACVSDACACDSGGDCECFCTAVAAYAQACHTVGVCVSWRTPEVCRECTGWVRDAGLGAEDPGEAQGRAGPASRRLGEPLLAGTGMVASLQGAVWAEPSLPSFQLSSVTSTTLKASVSGTTSPVGCPACVPAGTPAAAACMTFAAWKVGWAVCEGLGSILWLVGAGDRWRPSWPTGCYPTCPSEAPIFDEDKRQCVAKCSFHHFCTVNGKSYQPGETVPSGENCYSW